MFILICLLTIYFVYVITKLIVYILVKKYGSISYDGLTFVGFKYDYKKDAFIPLNNSWQRVFGYGYTYDLLAPFASIIIDTERVYFKYKDYNYLISFWKGQYGITTGAEIGIYRTKVKEVSKKTIYGASENLLSMSFILYKNGEKIIEVSDTNWWLAAFKLGMFSDPKDLKMDICITFPDKEFLDAFLESFKKLNHYGCEYNVIDNTFIFCFQSPKSKRVWTRNFLSDYFVQKRNKINVCLYQDYFDKNIERNGIDDSKSGYYILVSDLVENIFGDLNEKN